jgi:hypothetical protein
MVSNGNEPALPFEVIRRIIHWRLALTPSFPNQIQEDDPISPAWDNLAGQSGRQASVKRWKERLDTQDAALDLMRVCKSWKVSLLFRVLRIEANCQSVVMRYLYAEPAIQASNLLQLTTTVVNGDKKWSDINIHPHSLPGRYITTLDLSHLDDGFPSLHITTIQSALQALLPLLPNLTHLTLPARSPLRCEDIGLAPFAKRLKCLNGLSVYSFPTTATTTSEEKDPYVWLLGQLGSLEVLSIHGPGNTMDADSSLLDLEPTPISLSRLHTLSLDGVKSGSILRSLTASSLPALRRLTLTSYHDLPLDETYAFQSSHGHKLLSLTYLHSHEWPTTEATPPIETLELHPRLRHLSFVFPHAFLQANLELASGLTGEMYKNHPLEAITLPKWNENTRNQSPSPSPAATPLTQATNGLNTLSLSVPINTSRTPNRFLSTILKNPPRQLKVVTMDGFKWVRPDLGRRALEAGNSGTMRNWAVEMESRGIEMRDMEGNVLPKDRVVVDLTRGRRGGGRMSGPGAVFWPGAGKSRDRGYEDGS